MKWLLALFLGLASPAFASAGNDAGGGGNAVVCRDSSGRITSAESLDLFEAQVLHRWRVPISQENAILQTKRFIALLRLLNPRYQFFSVVEQIVGRGRVLEPEYKLEPIADAFPFIGKKGCAIEQLARYLSTDELLIDGEIWAALDETNKAALYLHELLYQGLRRSGAVNSLRARRIVGYLMADIPDRLSVEPPKEEKIAYNCQDNYNSFRTRFWVTLTETAETTELNANAYFSILNDRALVGRTSDSRVDYDRMFTQPRVGDVFVFTVAGPFERKTWVRLTVAKKTKDGILFNYEDDGKVGLEDQPLREQEKIQVLCQKVW